MAANTKERQVNVSLKALADPRRRRIMETMGAKEISPKELSESLGIALETTAYHVRVLKSAGLIELVETDRKRGAIIHRYKVTDFGGATMTNLGEYAGSGPA